MDRYVLEYEGLHNIRELDTINQMLNVVSGMELKRLKYNELTAKNGLSSGSRPATQQ